MISSTFDTNPRYPNIFRVISAYQRSATLEKAYLTDLFQEITDLGTAVHCVTIERGWKEIDTVEDYEKAVKVLKTLEE